MKNLPLKKIGIIGVGLAIVVFVAYHFMTGPKANATFSSINPAFGEYISSYTALSVNSGSTVRIVLAKDAIDSAAIGESSKQLFDFSPSIKGITVWLDRRTVEFRPSGRLKSGTVYEVSFFLSKLFQVAKDLETLKYSFQVIPQNYELSIDNVKPYVKTELARQKIEGTINTADFAESESVEKMVSAQQESRSLKISWIHASSGKQHSFVVEDVQRKEAASKVTLAVSGKSLDISHEEDREVEIPSLSDFKVTNVFVDQGSNQHVVIQFSDPLSENQNLEGMIAMSEAGTVDFEIKDNEVRVFPPVRQKGTRTLSIEAGIRNVLNYKMQKGGSYDVSFEQLLPAVRLTGKGTILPSSDGLILPFEAVNLKAVEVQIVKIFENNILQFLQVNDFAGNQELRRVGKPVYKKVISLENTGLTDLGKWNRFTLDLSKLISTEPGAIYQVRIRIKKNFIAYACDGGPNEEELVVDKDNFDEEGEKENSYWDSYQEYYSYGEGFDWSQRENPCNPAYYSNEKNITRNVIASDLGLIAKRGGDGSVVIAVNDLKTTKPMSGVEVEVYDYQQQVIGKATTSSDGMATVMTKKNPFVLVAKSGPQRGYLKLQDGESLSLSNFDVGGEQINEGIKGFLYGERGVWRPGDSLYLSFILEDKLKVMPASHPVIFELQNPQGQVTSRIVRSSSENGFYNFATATASDAPTGYWTGRVKVGGTEFTQPIRIETVKPNRLRIKLDFGVEKITADNGNLNGSLQVDWLHGAPGKNLKAQFDVLLTKGETEFARYPDYSFEDPSKTFNSESKNIFEGFTDATGHAIVNAKITTENEAPGVLNAIFRGKAFEESGNFSIDNFSIPFYPYQSYIGIRPPLGDKARGMLLTDTTHRVDVVTVDANGNPVSSRNIQMNLYKINWRWWWDNSSEESVNFMTGQYSEPIASGVINTNNGKGEWNFRVKYPEWGRFLIRAYDPQSGHTTAKIVYIDWPGWAGRARNESSGATMLSFSSDKPAYNIGEKATLTIPGSDNGRALISIENGSHVIKTFWLETKSGDNKFSFELTEDMTPNVFVNVTMLQPHSQTINDLPIRMYGVIPLQVENPDTHLDPVIAMPDVLEPGQEVTIKVSEKANRKMTYTLAMVDEGLLDLTHFRTPDAWSRFYAREALGVRTWDLYDEVMGSFGGRIERLLAIGGDGESAAKEDDSKSNRFKPVVKFFGPYTLSGGTKEHKFRMPQYIGSVKTMLVAGYEGAYGKTDKATPVRKPLMVMATLPRVLGPEENVKLPVTLFANEKSITNVSVSVKVTGPLTLSNGASRTVNFTGIGDKTTDFDLSVKGMIGFAKVEVTATSGNYKSTDVIDIEIRNPNPPVSKVQETILEAGKNWSTSVTPVGLAGTNSATLEVSSLPPINLGQRLKYLIQYPYGCIEQTTSSVFPQLFLANIKQLTDAEKAAIQKNVSAGIERLKSFMTRDGGFAYWPGGEDSDSWGSTYAGHFLTEAEAKGFFVPHDMLKKWKKYQRTKAQGWRKNQEYSSSELNQAYRLYTLALAGDADLGSMNRLRETTGLPVVAGWMLAAAYSKAGQPEAAKSLIANLSTNVKPYQEMAYSYGSDLRDKAVILETLTQLGDRAKGYELLKDISTSLNNDNYWMSTQTVAWCLKSVGGFAGAEQKGEMKFKYSYNGKDVSASTGLFVAQVNLPVDGAKGGLSLTNESKGILFVRVISEGTPARGQEESASNNLSMTVSYADADGNSVDPSQLEQGQEFVATVSIVNPGTRGIYKNMALKQIFPSGWEINNLRLDGAEDKLNSDKPTYQDIRDDRVYTYFDIGANQRKTFKVLLTASYAGTFYLPTVSCEAMYDHGIYSREAGQVVNVVKPVSQ
ncbi:hypothetical protein WSM22_09950 [Cytophagales bacterium WSM2-2]|nr:hypothetical protein WSM22_09950 [Cytophagales bacterium WSM2-2]